MSAAEAIREARVGAGMTQDELARRTGVRQPNIAAYENGKREPSPSMLERLLSATAPRASAVPAQHRAEVLNLRQRTAREMFESSAPSLVMRIGPTAISTYSSPSRPTPACWIRQG